MTSNNPSSSQIGQVGPEALLSASKEDLIQLVMQMDREKAAWQSQMGAGSAHPALQPGHAGSRPDFTALQRASVKLHNVERWTGEAKSLRRWLQRVKHALKVAGVSEESTFAADLVAQYLPEHAFSWYTNKSPFPSFGAFADALCQQYGLLCDAEWAMNELADICITASKKGKDSWEGYCQYHQRFDAAYQIVCKEASHKWFLWQYMRGLPDRIVMAISMHESVKSWQEAHEVLSRLHMKGAFYSRHAAAGHSHQPLEGPVPMVSSMLVEDSCEAGVHAVRSHLPPAGRDPFVSQDKTSRQSTGAAGPSGKDKKKQPPGACHTCGKKGHWSRDCPLRQPAARIHEVAAETQSSPCNAQRTQVPAVDPALLDSLVSSVHNLVHHLKVQGPQG